MIEYISALLLLMVALGTVSLRRTYNFFPVKELKRQARGGDRDAKVLFRAVAYGRSLRVLLWLVLGLAVACSLALLSDIAPAWLGGVAIAGVIWYAFAWAPHRRLTSLGVWFAVLVTPKIAWILHYTHRPLDVLSRLIASRNQITFHTGLFEREDLIELVGRQKELSDNRIDQSELDVVLHALSFGEKKVLSVMVPRSQVASVTQTDVVGPILMDELYESRHSRFPVLADDGESIVGTLYLRDMITARHGGMVKDAMQPQVHYVHTSQTLYKVLHAFLTTKNPLFIVVDDSESYVGIITIEDVIEQVIGQKIDDGFESYDDKQAVIRDTKPPHDAVTPRTQPAQQ